MRYVICEEPAILICERDDKLQSAMSLTFLFLCRKQQMAIIKQAIKKMKRVFFVIRVWIEDNEFLSKILSYVDKCPGKVHPGDQDKMYEHVKGKKR